MSADSPVSPVVIVALSLAAVVAWTGLPPDSATLVRPTPAGLVSADTIEVATNPLEAASLGFARALETGSSDDLARFLGSDGIRLQLEGAGHAGLSTRQAVAALRAFLRGHDGPTTVVTRAAPVEGSADRGFAEVFWTAHAAGTSDEIRRTLFLGFRLSNDDWRVDEVRFLR